jgi:hypothetical protein
MMLANVDIGAESAAESDAGIGMCLVGRGGSLGMASKILAISVLAFVFGPTLTCEALQMRAITAANARRWGRALAVMHCHLAPGKRI